MENRLKQGKIGSKMYSISNGDKCYGTIQEGKEKGEFSESGAIFNRMVREGLIEKEMFISKTLKNVRMQISG